MGLLSLAYVSRATRDVDDADILAILATSRSNNARDGITGALLYHRGQFVQILEGAAEQVRRKFELIAQDGLHSGVQLMREEAIPKRQFPEWTMGFEKLDADSGRSLDGFEDILGRRGADRVRHAENEAQQFLEWLAEYWLPRR